MFAHHYQGNAWWIAWGLFVLFLLSQALLSLRQKRKIGMPVGPRDVIAVCVVFLLFVALAIFQVLTHPGQ
jgi:hypothetical protein